MFAIKYLDSATKIQFDTCLTPIIIQVIGWSVAMLYTITMLVMNVWLMISFPENITETDYDYWYETTFDRFETGIMITWTSFLYLSLIVTAYSVFIIFRVTNLITEVKIATRQMFLHISLLLLLSITSVSTTVLDL